MLLKGYMNDSMNVCIDLYTVWSRRILVLGASVFVFLLLMGCEQKAEVTQKPLISFSGSTVNAGDNAFDGKRDSFWDTTGAFPHWIQKDYRAGKKVTKYILQTGPHGPDATGRMPKDWQLQGSHDGANWINLDERINQTGWKNDEERTYDLTIPATYRYYRLYFTAGNNPSLLRIYEIKMYEME